MTHTVTWNCRLFFFTAVYYPMSDYCTSIYEVTGGEQSIKTFKWAEPVSGTREARCRAWRSTPGDGRWPYQ